MRSISLGKRIAECALLVTVIMLLSGLFISPAALADNEGVAMSGTFAGQKYEIPAGSAVSSTDVFVTVISGYKSNIGIKMTCVAPVGVSVNLSATNFTLDPGESKSISIEIKTTIDAAAGNFPLSITATPYITNPGGVQLLPEITQSASLTIVGESAKITVDAVSPEGKPVTAVVRLYKLINERLSEVSYNASGHLETIVAPGNFTAQAYVGGKLLDEETFDVAKNDNKLITLQAGTIFFESPGVQPYYDNGSNKLAFTKVYYTLRNVYQKVDQVNVKLLVTLNGNFLEERDGSSFPFDIGRASGSFDYTPTSGWSNGVYGFTLKLFVNGVSYGNAPELKFEVKDGQAVGGGSTGEGSESNGGGSSILLIVGIICAAVILIAIAYFLIRKGRKSGPGKHKNENTKHKDGNKKHEKHDNEPLKKKAKSPPDGGTGGVPHL